MFILSPSKGVKEAVSKAVLREKYADGLLASETLNCALISNGSTTDRKEKLEKESSILALMSASSAFADEILFTPSRIRSDMAASAASDIKILAQDENESAVIARTRNIAITERNFFIVFTPLFTYFLARYDPYRTAEGKCKHNN